MERELVEEGFEVVASEIGLVLVQREPVWRIAATRRAARMPLSLTLSAMPCLSSDWILG
jgi:hypothetical protein